MSGPDRRRFLSSVLGTAAAAGVMPRTAAASGQYAARPPLPTPPGPVADEAYWELVRDQFPVREGLVMMNAANLCPSPYPVIDAVATITRDIDADASFQNRAKLGVLRGEARAALAAHVGADASEIAITRNTSEGNNTVVNGLTLQPGDEVVLWDQNHPTNNVAWDVKAERTGCVVRRVETPAAPRNADELIAPFREALTPRTKVVSFSHVSNASGIRMPAGELCALARDRGAFSLVDGAQSFGVLKIDLHAMGCDFYTGSSHKWFIGPKEAGLLYVRQGRIDDLWASNVGVGWSRALENGAQKFDNLGQRDDAAVTAMGTAARFHQTIGIEQIEARSMALVAGLRDRIRQGVPGVRFSPDVEPTLSAGVLVVIPPRGDPRALFDALYTKHHVAGAPRAAGVRLSPHLYNTLAQTERVAEAFAAEMS